WIDRPAELEKELAALPGVAKVFPRIQFYALLTNGNVTLSGRGQGIDGPAEASFFTNLNIVEGKTLEAEPDGVLLGKGLARSLNAKPGDRITVLGNTVHGSLNGADLVVTGIFHTGAKEFDDAVFRLPLKVTQTLLDTDKIESMAVGLHQLSDWTPVSTTLTTR